MGVGVGGHGVKVGVTVGLKVGLGGGDRPALTEVIPQRGGNGNCYSRKRRRRGRGRSERGEKEGAQAPDGPRR